MKVKCVLCDKIENLDDDGFEAKNLRNRPIHTFMCDECNQRITKRTEERFANKEYKVYHRQHKKEQDW
ncbi:MAG TPA: YlaI family protein [Bacillales bacterium]|nr:YlaI family protein [Bacillales bacterium]